MRSAFLLLACLLALPACRAFPGPPAADLTGMVVVPAGWFLMGEDDGRTSNQPRRWVYLDAFAIDRTEVTRQAYLVYLRESGYPVEDANSQFSPQAGNLPAAGVLWRNAIGYCRWTGKRLPSEAEWEKAARGADGRRYPWGDDWSAGLANTAQSGLGTAVPAGRYPGGISPYGALDMAGNVAEWVADFYDPTYYTWATNWNPTGPQRILDHGLRGGSWDSSPDQATTFFRDSSHSARPNLRTGFRCARSLEAGGD